MVGLTDIDQQRDPRAPVAGSAATRSHWWKAVLREPLFHFLILGLVLFGAYALLSSQQETQDEPLRIELTGDDIRQLAVMWLAQGRPLPTPKEMQSLVDQKVGEEILAREAVVFGLDRDDQVIKRRLAQKMDFLLADLAALQPPTAEALADWYATQGARFALAPHMSFRHLYYSFDRPDAGERATAALAQVRGLPPDAPVLATAADPFMFKNFYGDATPEQMAKDFGPGFAEALFALAPDSWQGPIQSGYGWHLIYVSSFEPGRVPAFEEVEPQVREAWLNDRYREVKERAFAEMRSRYTVVVPRIEDVDLQNLSVPATSTGPE